MTWVNTSLPVSYSSTALWLRERTDPAASTGEIQVENSSDDENTNLNKCYSRPTIQRWDTSVWD